MPTPDATPVGRVVGLWRYPVKSMAAEMLDEAPITWQGIAGDRRWAFVRDRMVQSGFPWLTLRQHPGMNRYTPTFVDPTRPESSATVVTSPSGETLEVTDPKLAEELHPEGARVLRQSRGAFDAFPLSVISIQSIDAIGRRVGLELEPGRFRPNILLDLGDGEPFAEDQWVGRTLQIGGTRVRIDKRDGRCVVITTDVQTGSRSPEILEAVAKSRDGCLGVYASTVDEGTISIGDVAALDPA
ncbi:MAG: MOSC N-terminal beta barrel domain-containing protein [Gemmatimonadota bacterium]